MIHTLTDPNAQDCRSEIQITGEAGVGVLAIKTVSSRDAAIRAYMDVFTASLDR